MQLKPFARVVTVLIASMVMLVIINIAAPMSPVQGSELTTINTGSLNQNYASLPFVSPMQAGITDTASTTPTTTLTETVVFTPTSTITIPTATPTPTEEPTTSASSTPNPTATNVSTEPSPTPAEQQLGVISGLITLVQTKPWIPLGFVFVILVTALTLILTTAQRNIKAEPPIHREGGSTAPLPSKPIPAQERAFLQLKHQPEMTFPLAIDDITIGRASDNSIVIPPDVPGAETVSHYHARLYRLERWVLEDLDSTNGIYVNGQRTGRNYLRNGWEIGIGSVIFIFRMGKVEI